MKSFYLPKSQIKHRDCGGPLRAAKINKTGAWLLICDPCGKGTIAPAAFNSLIEDLANGVGRFRGQRIRGYNTITNAEKA